MKKIVKSNTSLDEPLEKRELEKAISEKEKRLNELIDEIEQLKIDLTIIKNDKSNIFLASNGTVIHEKLLKVI